MSSYSFVPGTPKKGRIGPNQPYSGARPHRDEEWSKPRARPTTAPVPRPWRWRVCGVLLAPRSTLPEQYEDVTVEATGHTVSTKLHCRRGKPVRQLSSRTAEIDPQEFSFTDTNAGRFATTANADQNSARSICLDKSIRNPRSTFPSPLLRHHSSLRSAKAGFTTGCRKVQA
jgi:hypothetical protein